MLTLGIKKAEKFVREQRARGSLVRWDGWDLVFFKPLPAAVYDKAGSWNREANSYGYETRVSPNDAGLWEIDWRNVRRGRG